MEEKHNVADLSYLNELANGDRSFVKEMITVFLEQTPEAISKLEKYYSEKNWKMLRATAHKMKPSFSFVGLKETAVIMNSIEEYSENEIHLELLPEMISTVKNTCSKVMAELQGIKNNL